MGKSYCNLLYHIVFSTHLHRRYLLPDLQPRVFQYLGGTIRNEGGIALVINGMEDHVHILAKLRQDRAVSDVLRDIKSNSSGWIHDQFPAHQDFAW
jgi:REP element-mobilizing transposase RayT